MLSQSGRLGLTQPTRNICITVFIRHLLHLSSVICRSAGREQVTAVAVLTTFGLHYRGSYSIDHALAKQERGSIQMSSTASKCDLYSLQSANCRRIKSPKGDSSRTFRQHGDPPAQSLFCSLLVDSSAMTFLGSSASEQLGHWCSIRETRESPPVRHVVTQ